MEKLDDKQKFWMAATAAGLAGACWWLLKPREGYFDKWAQGDINTVLPGLDPRVSEQDKQDIANTAADILMTRFRAEQQAREAALQVVADADFTPQEGDYYAGEYGDVG